MGKKNSNRGSSLKDYHEKKMKNLDILEKDEEEIQEEVIISFDGKFHL